MRNKDGSRHMHRIIEVCLLVLLCDPEVENAHGYALGERLKEFGFDASEISVSTLYRTLRGMEDAGWVTSSWAAGGQGPQRRQYAITDAGRQALDRWAAVLTRRRERIDRVLEAHAQLGRTPAEDATPPAEMQHKPKPRDKAAPSAGRQSGQAQAAGQPEEEPVENEPASAPRREESFVDYWD
jgi:PadR family transcriptional regulator PadR